jgi:hypothetical protein
MTWVITIVLLALLVPNLVKFLSVSTNLISFLPMYLQSIRQNPSILEDKESSTRLTNAFTTIFYSIELHGLNVLVLGVLSWSLWEDRLPNLSTLLKGILWGVVFAASILNLVITFDQVREFVHVQKSSRLVAQLISSLGQNQPPSALTITATLQIWAWIGVYAASAVASAFLLYLIGL